MIIAGPAAQQTAAQFTHPFLKHLLDFMRQRAVSQSALYLVAHEVKFSDDFGMIGKTLLQRSALGTGLGLFIFHELLPLTQSPQKSATNLSPPPTSYDCTPSWGCNRSWWTHGWNSSRCKE